MKKCIFLSISAIILLTLVACGTPDNIYDLYKNAKRKYGDCTIVDKVYKEDGGVRLTLRDDVQGFEYEVYSGMQGIFVSTPYKNDNFREQLYYFIVDNTKEELDSLCTGNRRYEFDESHFYEALRVYSNTEEDTISFAKECAQVLNSHNLSHRLDSYKVYAMINDFSKEYYGSVLLPEISWLSLSDERKAIMIDYVQKNFDANAEFVRVESKPFSKSGANFENVLEDFGDDYFNPVFNEESLVDYYYFKSSTGREFYVCNFIYAFEGSENTWNELYTNY